VLQYLLPLSFVDLHKQSETNKTTRKTTREFISKAYTYYNTPHLLYLYFNPNDIKINYLIILTVCFCFILGGNMVFYCLFLIFMILPYTLNTTVAH